MKSRIQVTAVLLAASLLPGLAASPATAANYASCGSVSYGSSAPLSTTHYGADNIKALNVACRVAKKVAAASENGHNHRYSYRGFNCVGRGQQYACVKDLPNGRARVKFNTVGLG